MSQEKKDLSNLKVPVICYSRSVGYYAPVQNFNKGKRQEFSERKLYNMPLAISKVQEESSNKPEIAP